MGANVPGVEKANMPFKIGDKVEPNKEFVQKILDAFRVRLVELGYGRKPEWERQFDRLVCSGNRPNILLIEGRVKAVFTDESGELRVTYSNGQAEKTLRASDLKKIVPRRRGVADKKLPPVR